MVLCPEVLAGIDHGAVGQLAHWLNSRDDATPFLAEHCRRVGEARTTAFAVELAVVLPLLDLGAIRQPANTQIMAKPPLNGYTGALELLQSWCVR